MHGVSESIHSALVQRATLDLRVCSESKRLHANKIQAPWSLLQLVPNVLVYALPCVYMPILEAHTQPHVTPVLANRAAKREPIVARWSSPQLS